MAQSILITGASSGIGRVTAQRFLQAGWNVGLLARRKDLLDEIAAGHPQARVLAYDISDVDQIEQAFAEFMAAFGRLDVLFNNAGIFTPAATPDLVAVDNWAKSIAVNLTGSFLCARAAFAIMRTQDPQGGRIINNGSISAHTPRPGSVAYTTTKHAITGLTKSLALDGREFDIACGQIDIGNADTEMVLALNAKIPEGAPINPTMDVNHVADAVLNMAELPLRSNVLFMTIMATQMPFVGRG